MNSLPPTMRNAFLRLLGGDALTQLAMMTGQVALPWWITVRNGAHDLAVYATVSAAVACVAIPLLAPLGDRLDKRRLIVGGLITYAIGALALALLATRDHYDIRWIAPFQALSIGALAVVTPLTSTVAAELLPAARLSQGLQRQKLFQSAGQLLGPIVGGGALAIANVALALWLQLALSLAAIACLLHLPACTATHRRARGPWLTELTAGMRAKWHIGLERYWTLISFLVGICLLPSLGMLLPLKVHSLGLDGRWLGICETTVSCGLLAGAWYASDEARVDRLGRYTLRFAAMSLLGPMLVLVGFSAKPWLLALSLAIVGALNSLVVMMGYSRRIIATPHAFRTRMTAANIMLTQLAGLIGPALAGMGLRQWPVESIYLGFGIALALCSLGYLVTPDFRLFFQLDDAGLEGWYARRYPQAFGGGESTVPD
ncbi:MFS transporter [Dyella sp.]|uniref:MFS transporter n=1 Tax=Dyella sp. TaxID=1869338 RepID=UPI002ED34D90